MQNSDNKVLTKTQSNKVRFEYIDFLKGAAILFVLLAHSLTYGIYAFHVLQGVPVFLAITFFLTFRNIENNSSYNMYSWYYKWDRIKKTLTHVYLPYVLTIALQLVILIALQFARGGENLIHNFFNTPIGIGPGTYYIYIYTEFWILMPFIYAVLTISKNHKYIGIIIIFLISILLNILSSLVDIPNSIYKVLFFKYLFLSVIGYVWLKYDISWKWVIILSAISIVYWFVTDCNFGILTYNCDAIGGTHNWPSYFYTLLYIKLLIKVYDHIKNTKIARFFNWIGKESWYIFLLQMFILGFVTFSRFSTIMEYFEIDNIILQRCIYVVFAYLTAILPVWFVRYYQSHRNSLEVKSENS